MGPERKENRTLAASHASDDVLWLAFRYVHDELSAGEAEAFEELLATEQAAREALAEAVKLSDVLHAAMTREAVAVPSAKVVGLHRPPAGRAWRLFASHSVIAAAACLAVLLMVNAIWTSGFRSGNSADNEPTSDPTTSTFAQQLLAQAYVDAGPIMREPGPSDPPHEPDDADPVEASPPIPGLADDWIALGLIAAHQKVTNAEEKR